MISINLFNRSKERAIFFVHGLFANSGFWINHIREFKAYRIVLCNIDYDYFCEEPGEIINCCNELIANNNVFASVSHSFGSVVNSQINANIACFDICPILHSERVNRIDFISEMSKKTGKELTEIEQLLKKADVCLKYKLNDVTFSQPLHTSLVPSNYKFFNYINKSNFVGDHFHIDDAIKKIKKLIDELN